jgi:hypothetical protein
MYSNVRKKDLKPDDDEYMNELVKYCDVIVEYFKEIIEGNVFTIIENGTPIDKQLYLVKKEKYYPEIIQFKVEDEVSYRPKTKRFVPYLIYDDLLDCFAYNRQILTEKTQVPCDINTWSENKIITRLSEQKEGEMKDFQLNDIYFEMIE